MSEPPNNAIGDSTSVHFTIDAGDDSGDKQPRRSTHISSVTSTTPQQSSQPVDHIESDTDENEKKSKRGKYSESDSRQSTFKRDKPTDKNNNSHKHDTHNQEVDRNEKKFPCEVCSKVFFSSVGFRKHNLLKHKPDISVRRLPNEVYSLKPTVTS